MERRNTENYSGVNKNGRTIDEKDVEAYELYKKTGIT